MHEMIDNPTMVPASIPPEILAKIFCLVPGPRIANGRFPEFERLNFFNVTEIIPLTIVCRYWREVAVGTPFLWSTIIDRVTVDGTTLFEHYVHRCHSGPLSVSCESNPSDAVLDLLQAEGYRVRALGVNCDHYFPEDKFTTLVSTPLPQLVECAISTRRSHTRTYPNLFGGSQQLRTLHLSGHISHPTGPYPSLVSFSAEDLVPQDSFATMTAPLDDFLDLLSQAPNLEAITFSFLHHTDDPGRTGYRALKHARLARLKSLSVWDTNKSIHYMNEPSDIAVSILEHISFPPSCELTLNSVYPHELAPIDRYIGPGRTPTHLRLRYNTYRFAVRIETVDPQTARQTSIRVTAGHHIFEPDDAACPTDIGTRMIGLSLFANIHCLWFQHRFRSEFEGLFDPAHSVLHALPHLECLLLSNYAPRATRRSAYTPIGELVGLLEAGNMDGEPPWCPALSVLAFSIWEKPDWDDGCVHRLIKSRAERGCPLERLLVGQWSRTDGSGPADEPADTAEEICTVYEYDGRGILLRVYMGVDSAYIVHDASRWRLGGSLVLDFPSMFELYQ
ncbi:hypothetical protein C8Q80DRAFT_760585 [Daedaleopsis nitida]|nr:hypothetical protein C8Q80DRAFT_760585 [Daedaleopsis nitida]